MKAMSSETSALRDKLIGAVIGIARSCMNNPKTVSTDKIVIAGLSACINNNSGDSELIKLIDRAAEEKKKIVPGCINCAARCGNTDDYNMDKLWLADEEIRSLKNLLLSSLFTIASNMVIGINAGYSDEKLLDFVYYSLFIISQERTASQLLPIIFDAGKHITESRKFFEMTCC